MTPMEGSFPDGGGSSLIRGFTIQPWGTSDIETDGTGGLQSGAIELQFDQVDAAQVEGSEVFSLLGNHVSVDSSPPRDRHQVYVSFDPDSAEGENTGIAIYNPDPASSALVSATLVDDQGSVSASTSISVEPTHQFLGFVDDQDLFKAFFQSLAAPFHGTLNLHVTQGPDVAVIGLIQKRSNGALIAFPTGHNPYPSLPGDCEGTTALKKFLTSPQERSARKVAFDALDTGLRRSRSGAEAEERSFRFLWRGPLLTRCPAFPKGPRPQSNSLGSRTARAASSSASNR